MVHGAPDTRYSMELCSVLSLIRTHTRENFDTLKYSTKLAKLN